MSNMEDKLRIPLFDGKDFFLWKRRVLIALKQKNAERAIQLCTGTDVCTIAQENDAQSIIFNTLGPSVAVKVMSCETALDVWKRLLQIYESTDQSNVDQMLESYYTYRKDLKDDMSTHISKVEKMASQLNMVGQPQSEKSVMTKMLSSLPSSFDALKEAWKSVASVDKTRDNLISRLLGSETVQKVKEEKNDVALITSERDRLKRDGSNKPGLRNKIKCYNCQQFGYHIARDCKEPAVPRQQERLSPKTSIAMVAGVSNSGKEEWIVDSGASRHICCRKDWFEKLENCDEQLQVGNNEIVRGVGSGEVKVSSTVNGVTWIITLHDVLYVPSMPFNLFSTGRALRVSGASISFDKMGCSIKLDKTVIAKGKTSTQNNLCTLLVEPIKSHAMIVSTKRTIEEWHEALGHVDAKVIEKMAKDGSATGLEIRGETKGEQCQACPAGKGTKASHTVRPSTYADKVGDIIDMDLIGPMSEPSLGGKKYILLVRDRFSSYLHLNLLKSKDEVALSLQHYIGLFESESGSRVRSFHTDNGSEFTNSRVKTLCDIEHIKLCFSAPYTPQQNGTAERSNRTIISTIRTMLVASNLPVGLWGEAAATAVYLRNRVTKIGRKQTPFELFTGRKPFLGHIVKFGTSVQSLINDRRLGKFDARTEPGFIVGFTERSNTYRIYLPADDRVKVSSDVIFRHHTPAEQDVTIAESWTEPMGTVEQSHENSSNHPEQVNETSGQPIVHPLDLFAEETSVSSEHPIDTCGAELAPDQHNENVTQRTPPPLGALPTGAEEETVEDLVNSLLRDVKHITNSEQGEYLATSGSNKTETPAGPPTNVTMPIGEYSLEVVDPFRGRAIPRESSTTNNLDISDFVLKVTDVSGDLEEPTTIIEISKRGDATKWWSAIKAELEAHKKNKTWTLVKKPVDKNILTTKWVFTRKRNSAGLVDRYKARLVARGFQQREGVDYAETFAPVARLESVRLILMVASLKNYSVDQFDVSTAFLNGSVEEDVYVEIPEGLQPRTQRSNSSSYCLKLNKALYGLKQAPRVWNSVFNQKIKQLGFTASPADPCLYTKPSKEISLLIYVDDGLIIGPSRTENLKIIADLAKSFEVRYISEGVFLGIQITKMDRGLHLSQSRYTEDVLNRFNMAECQPERHPLVDTRILFELDSPPANVPYRAAIGSLLYLAQATRPDILYPTILLSKFNENPLQVHWKACKWIMKYLKGTMKKGLILPGPSKDIEVSVYCDADWGGCLDNRKSTTGIVILVGGAPVVFVSRQQGSVAQSSTEAEFIAASEACKELVWLLEMLKSLGLKHNRAKIHIDNRSTIELIKNPDVKRRSKHIEIRYHFVRDLYLKKLFELVHVPSEKQLADFLTKRLPADRIAGLLIQVGLVDRDSKKSGRGQE